MVHEPLNILIVDDTITYRTILRGIVSDIPNTNVVDTAFNGKVACEKLNQHHVDLVLLDIEMPEMDGMETLQHIRKNHPGVSVVMVSGMNRSSADITIRALQSGAVDFIPKPDSDSLVKSKSELLSQLQPVIQHFLAKRQAKIIKTPATAPHLTTSAPLQAGATQAPRNGVLTGTTGRFDVLAIGASTGGPNALNTLISALPDDLNVPILIVQHMPPLFTESLANSLNKKSALQVKEAAHGEPVKPNVVYIAPGGKHMVVQRDASSQAVTIGINEEPPENSCRPAVDVLFRSVGQVYGPKVLSVVLTGMGTDGALGVRKLKDTGCYSIIQSEKTCVIYGMPKAVENLQMVDETLDLDDMADRLTQLIKGRVQI